jgi:hypothetical protein
MIVTAEVRIKWKEPVMVYYKVLFNNFPAGTFKNYTKPKKRLPLAKELDSRCLEYKTDS